MADRSPGAQTRNDDGAQPGAAGSPITRSTFVPILAAYVQSIGVDPSALLQRFSLPATVATMSQIEIPLATARALYDATEQLLGDPNLGLHIARARARGQYGVLEFTTRNAPNMRAAFERLIRFQRLLNDLVQISVERHGDWVVIELRIAGEPECFGRHCNEYGLALFLIFARELSRTPVMARQVTMAHGPPADCSELAAFFGTTNLRFSTGRNAIALDATVLELPVISADQTLLPVMESYAELLVQAPAPTPAPTPDLLAEVRAQIRGALAEGPRIQLVAETLRLSPRTLQRRLEDAGSSFNQLVDEVRMQVACEHLTDRALTIAQVAVLLGYAEARPFLRAFKRWTGKTPQQYRGELTRTADGAST